MNDDEFDLDLSDDLEKKIDLASDLTDKDRNEIIHSAVENYEEGGSIHELREEVMRLYMEGEVEYNDISEFVGEEIANVLRYSRRVIDNNDAYASDISDNKRMLVLDKSSILMLADHDVLLLVAKEFDVHTTSLVIRELEEESYEFNTANRDVWRNIDLFNVHSEESYQSKVLDYTKMSCISLSNKLRADYIVTDEIWVVPEYVSNTMSTVIFSAVLLKALVNRGIVLS